MNFVGTEALISGLPIFGFPIVLVRSKKVTLLVYGFSPTQSRRHRCLRYCTTGGISVPRDPYPVRAWPYFNKTQLSFKRINAISCLVAKTLRMTLSQDEAYLSQQRVPPRRLAKSIS